MHRGRPGWAEVKPPPFAYHAPRTVDEALRALADGDAAPAGADGGDAGDGGGIKVLAGGQSLIPLLNMRLAAPGHIVDINRVAGLDTLEVSPAGVRVGALARLARVERSAEAVAVQPLLRAALRHVAHPAIRNRGTVVGSLVHADPAAELPAVLALLGGTLEVVSAAGPRVIAAADAFTGPLESAVRPGELATGAFFPALPAGSGTAFAEVTRRHGDYAMAGAAALVCRGPGGRLRSAHVAYFGVGATPVVIEFTGILDEHAATGAGRALRDGDWTAAAAHARDHLDPDEDIHASAAYRRHLVGVLTERVLREAAQAAQAAGTAATAEDAGEGT